MARGKGGQQYYDDDDFDDGYDDWDYADYDEEEKEDPLATSAPPPKSQPSAASASSSHHSEAQRKVVASMPAAVGQKQDMFDFSTASPDDVVLAARQQPSGVAKAELDKESSAKEAPPQQQMAQLNLQQPREKVPLSAKALHQAIEAKQSAMKPAMPTTGFSEKPRVAAIEASGQSKARVHRPYSEFVQDPAVLKALLAADNAAASEPGSRTRLHLVVMGHVDAGKSTLMGRLLADLEVVSQKQVHKQQTEAARAGKGSFSWAWLLDERAEERARGVTVDVATAQFQTDRHAVTLLDAPGHRDFVPNMIAGTSQADAGLLVVDGSTGGFESGFDAAATRMGGGGGGQTREHAQLAKSLGVDQLAVVVTKLDTCGFDYSRFEHIKAMLGPFLKSCGFRDSAVQWLPACAPGGQNLVSPPTEPQLASWWRGPCLTAAIDAFVVSTRSAVQLPMRLCINDVFRSAHGHSMVSGKLEGGGLCPAMSVAVLPSGQSGSVKAIEGNGSTLQSAFAGDSVDIILTGVDIQMISRGCVVCHPVWPVPLVTRFRARLLVLEPPIPVLQGQQVTLHAHCVQETGLVSRLLALLDPKTGLTTRQRPRCLLKGQTGTVEVTSSRPLPLELYTDYRALGRLALRDGGRTIAVGVVTELMEWQ